MGEHIPYKDNKSLTGTARYASINAHKGMEQSRRDDLEAIGHMLFYFLRGVLPWSGLDAKTQEEKYRKICEKKESTPVEKLNMDFPTQFNEYLIYCRKLPFTERPNYNHLQELMSKCREASWKDHHYQWFDGDNKEPTHQLVPIAPRGDLSQPEDRNKQPKSSKGCFCLC